MRPINDFKSNDYSQFGEDGIIKEFFFRLTNSGVELNKWACELGAWDGLYLSNSANLVREAHFSAVLIEGNPKRIKDLHRNFPSDNVVKICSFVTPDGETSLDKLLLRTPIPKDFDFLSIDVDGMDYYILESIMCYRPKLICIEINPTIPNVLHFVQPKDSSIKQGASAKAISELAALKDYEIFAATYCNVFLGAKELLQLIDEPIMNLDELVPHGANVQYLFSGYDGTILSNKNTIDLAWHGSFPIEGIQILPKFFRKYSGDYSRFQWYFFKAFLFLKTVRVGKILKR